MVGGGGFSDSKRLYFRVHIRASQVLLNVKNCDVYHLCNNYVFLESKLQRQTDLIDRQTAQSDDMRFFSIFLKIRSQTSSRRDGYL